MHAFQRILKHAPRKPGEIIEGILDGGKLSAREAEELYRSDLHLLTSFADYLREVQAGGCATFIINRQINYTNVCESRCSFCAYYRDMGGEDGYTMSLEEIVNKASQATAQGATELHIVGSHNPEIPFEYYEDLLKTLKARFPSLALKAFTASEVHFFSKNFEMSHREVLERLKLAGLDFMPGGGAEILDDRLRKRLCPGKATSKEWLEIMRCAHRLGIRTNATMLFGHIESLEQRIRHMLRLRELQKETGGFLSFIPLVYQPENNPLGKRVKAMASGVDILKTVAMSRLLLGESFRNVRAYWVMMGKKLAQIALRSGASDLDGTVMEERVAHEAGAISSCSAEAGELIAIIRKAGLVPAQRSTDFRVIRSF